MAYRSLVSRAVIGFILVVASAATPADPDCRALLLRTYRDMQQAGTPGQKKILHFEFTSESVFRPAGQATDQRARTSGHVYVQGSRLYFTSPELTMWQDGRFVSVVVPKRRLVYLTTAPPATGLTGDPLALMRENLIRNATLENCNRQISGNQVWQRIRLKPEPAIREQYGFQTLDFTVAATSGQLRQLTATYSPGHRAKKIILTLLRQQWLTATPLLPTDALAKVVDGQHRLLPAYKGYQLLDQTRGTLAR